MAWPKSYTFLERFWKKVNFRGPVPSNCPELGPCWLWTAYTDEFGRGQFWTGRKLVHAHVIAWELCGERVPDGMVLLHRCDVAGCLNPAHIRPGTQPENMAEMVSRGLHNPRGMRHPGRPVPPRRDHVPTFEERFWAKVNKNGPIPTHQPELGPCWVWTGSTNQCCYGLFGIGGSGNIMVAHKVYWKIIAKRELPAGMELLHTCDNPSCVRLEHLRTGTHKENMQDMKTKGRIGTSERAGPASWLSHSQAHEIKQLLDGGTEHKEIMSRFGISRSSVSRLARGIWHKYLITKHF